MNWTKDNSKISIADLAKVFKYEEKPTTLITWESGNSEPHARSLLDSQWQGWLAHQRHDKPDSEPAVYIILAKSGLPNTPLPWGPSSNEMTTAPASNAATRGKRSLRTVPFSQVTFRHITEHFCIHGSISAVVNRADVPVFSHAQVRMTDSTGQMRLAHVYNCRSSNSWEKDLALTITYLPECRKTYCIMFGCDEVIETEVQKRLFAVGPDIFFPLVMPGILVELERVRHMGVVTKALGLMETKIAELESIHNLMDEGFASREAEQRSSTRRTLWLDTAYLRDGLTTWKAQLERLRYCVADLGNSQKQNHKQDQTAQSGHSADDLTCHAKTSQIMANRIEAIEEEYSQAILSCSMRHLFRGHLFYQFLQLARLGNKWRVWDL
ncbi:uncharacterized protein PG998_000181 [Apiospora kogelbergensis]|uniref:uncharacterized protein n=1 Tax=Apiospora kogelbergensis TaxID=1337665 RepID=UPI00313201A4